MTKCKRWGSSADEASQSTQLCSLQGCTLLSQGHRVGELHSTDRTARVLSTKGSKTAAAVAMETMHVSRLHLKAWEV